MRNLVILTACALAACQDVGHLTPRDDPDGMGDTDSVATCHPHVLDQHVHLAASNIYGALWTPSAGGRTWGGLDRVSDQGASFRMPAGWPGVDTGEWRDVSAAADGPALCIVEATGDLRCAWYGEDWLPPSLAHSGLSGAAIVEESGCVLAGAGDIVCHRRDLGDSAPAQDLRLPGSWVDLAFMIEGVDPRHWDDISVLALDDRGRIGAAGAMMDENLPDVACANELVTEPNAAVCWTDADDRIGCLLRYPEGIHDFFAARYAWMDDLPTTGGWHDLALGDAHLCALDADGRVHCWASGDDALGPPPDGTGFVALASGGMTACAAKADGATTCWGQGEYVVAGAPAAAP